MHVARASPRSLLLRPAQDRPRRQLKRHRRRIGGAKLACAGPHAERDVHSLQRVRLPSPLVANRNRAAVVQKQLGVAPACTGCPSRKRRGRPRLGPGSGACAAPAPSPRIPADPDETGQGIPFPRAKGIVGRNGGETTAAIVRAAPPDCRIPTKGERARGRVDGSCQPQGLSATVARGCCVCLEAAAGCSLLHLDPSGSNGR